MIHWHGHWNLFKTQYSISLLVGKEIKQAKEKLWLWIYSGWYARQQVPGIDQWSQIVLLHRPIQQNVLVHDDNKLQWKQMWFITVLDNEISAVHSI